jgi:tetratricopeptide (TPR) repeat protein
MNLEYIRPVRGFFVRVLAVAAFLPATMLSAAADDVDVCTSYLVKADARLAACNRLLSQRSYSGVRSRLYLNRGMAYLQKEDADRALEDINKAVSLEPGNDFILVARSEAWFAKGELDRAMADADRAGKINPKSDNPYLLRGKVWGERGDIDRSIREISEAIRLNSKGEFSYNARALQWQTRGDYDKALADFDQAIRLSSKNGKFYANRGAVWLLKGDIDRALADQNTAIRLDPTVAYYLSLRGDSWRYKGEFKLAFADYDEALRLGANNHVPAYTGRGLTFEKMGEQAKARIEYVQAVTVEDPTGKVALSRERRETAAARLAALDSGAPQPRIQSAPSRANATSIPTPAATASVVVPAAVKATAAKQGRRVALVIGNSAYKNVSRLTNPQRDAETMAAALRNVGFDVVRTAADADREKLAAALRGFANDAEKSDWAVVYYAGHGMEMNGVNYLVPTDAKLAADRDVQFEAVPLEQVMVAVEGASKLKVVILDACRDNPFAPQMRKTAAPEVVAAATSTAGGTVGARSVGRGLGAVKVAGATLVVYAAKHGQVALDGDGANSPFAVALTQRMATPGVEINKIFRLVRDDVMEATAGRQEPFTYGSLPGKEDFFFVAAK